MTTKKPAQDTTEPIEGMPEAPKKPQRAEKLFIAYDPAENGDFHDVCVFGTKLGALEFAMEQTPPWKVTEGGKGHPLRGVVGL